MTSKPSSEGSRKCSTARRVLSLKFQRNLYYSLSGSTGTDKEAVEDKHSLKQNFLAFIVWEEET